MYVRRTLPIVRYLLYLGTRLHTPSTHHVFNSKTTMANWIIRLTQAAIQLFLLALTSGVTSLSPSQPASLSSRNNGGSSGRRPSTSLFGIRSTLARARDSIFSKERSDADLKDGIAFFYDRSSKLWEDVWGEHMHHGYYVPEDRTVCQFMCSLLHRIIISLYMKRIH